MKTKLTLVALMLFLGFQVTNAQQDEECMTNLSIFSEYAKAKNYDAAFDAWMKVRTKCPKLNLNIYSAGENILEHKIENATGTEQINFINDLKKLWGERSMHFESKTSKGEYGAKSCQLMYDNREVLGLSDEELYECFDTAYKADPDTFTNPKSLYTYFSLMVDLFDAKKKTDAELFNKYDDVADKIEKEVGNYSEDLNKLIEKEETGTNLTSKQESKKRYYESYLNAYEQISSGIDKKLGDRANCENLIPLYNKDFEANKTNAQWLQRAMNKLYEKGCKEDPMFVKVVKQKNSIEPNAKTSYYLYLITGEQKYFDQTLKLETDPFRKAKLYNTIAKDFKDKGSYGKAREYFTKALQINPSDKKPHSQIAYMYGSSANDCGDSTFNKRAVFWLAAEEARKAGNTSLAENFMAKAPTKTDIFNESMSGKSINIGCWIQRTVTVPKI